jgi:hypothetical protein
MPVYDFETYVRGERPEPEKATATITKQGTLNLNRRAYSLLGEPKMVLLRYDARHKVVGVRAIEERDKNAYVVRKHSSSSIYSVAFQGFATFYKIGIEESRRYNVEVADGTLVIDTTKPMGRVIEARDTGHEN